MKTLIAVLLLTTAALAQPPPDPRDSVIIESRVVMPLSGPCASAGLRVKIWITNKDSLANISLPLRFHPISGSAYATLSRSAACTRTLPAHAFDFLYPPGPGSGQRLTSRVANYATGYNSIPRDSVLWAFTLADPNNNDEKMPPNLSRAVLGEIKFDTVQAAPGQFVIDSSKVLGSDQPLFVALDGSSVFPNIVKGIITVSLADPRDSVIIESQYIARGNGACGSGWYRAKVWITNKDSLANITLPLETRSTSSSAYGIISRLSNCTRSLTSAAFDFLYPPETSLSSPRLGSRGASYANYHSNSPDTFVLAFTTAGQEDDEKMPPNSTRALLGELKFDTVLASPGTFEIDSGHVLANYLLFVDLGGNPHPPNFVKGVITVIFKGDLNLDGDDLPDDVVLLLNCVFLGNAPPAGSEACDVNCDGIGTSADFVVILNAVFLGTAYPC